MINERQMQETVARCVSIMVFYHNSKKSQRAEMVVVLIDDAQAVAGWASEAAMEEPEVRERLFRPVTSELVARYGEDVGMSLSADFQHAFGWTSLDSPDHPIKGP
jgi:hypothetical protein